MGNKRVHGLEDKDACNLTPSPLEWSFLDVSSQDKNFLKQLGAVFSHGLDILTPKLPKISPDIAISAGNTTLYMISNLSLQKNWSLDSFHAVSFFWRCSVSL